VAIENLDNNEIPWFGYNDFGENWKEIFVHPKNAFGVLIQIAQSDPDLWLSEKSSLNNKKWSVKPKVGLKRTIEISHPGGGKICLDLTDDEVQELIKDLS